LPFRRSFYEGPRGHHLPEVEGQEAEGEAEERAREARASN